MFSQSCCLIPLQSVAEPHDEQILLVIEETDIVQLFYNFAGLRIPGLQEVKELRLKLLP